MEQLYLAWLTERLQHYLDRPVSEDEPVPGHDLDSVAVLNLYGDIEEAFGPLIDPTDIGTHPTPRELARHMVSRDLRPGIGHAVRPAFAFTGLGAEHPGMTSALYIESAPYRTALDEAADALRPFTGTSVVDVILSSAPQLRHTALAQPALFAVGYALARALECSGVTPVAVIGQGIGEFAAAVLCGALSLPAAARLVALRGAFCQGTDPGGMLATGLSVAEAERLTAKEPLVGVAALNAPRSTVLSGDSGALERVMLRLAAQGDRCVRLPAAHAFHSPLMRPVTARFTAAARRVPGGAPHLPFYSTLRGRLTGEPLYASYWTEQLTAPVRFAEAAGALLDQQTPSHVVEIGPRPVLLPYLRRIAGRKEPVLRAVCTGPRSGQEHLARLLADLRAAAPPALAGS